MKLKVLIIKTVNFIINEYNKINCYLKGYNDYFEIPFDFNKPMPYGADIVMKNCCEVLEELDIDYFITDGTALGLYRNGNFIPHDNDIDIDIKGDFDFDTVNELFLNKLNMKLGRKLIYKGKFQQVIYYSNNNVIFDMVIWERKDDYYYNYVPEVPYPRKQNRKFFDKKDNIIFNEKKYPVHGYIEEWLEVRYGKEWMVPKSNKGDWREDCNDFDIILK